MDKLLEDQLNRVAELGLQQMRMLLAESVVAKAKSSGEITDDSYKVFREVADKHWGRWSKKVKRLEQKR